MDNIVNIKNLRKTYVQGHEELVVLDGVDFSIGAGEFVSVVGPSGSGKSTFLNIVALLDDSYQGELKLFGHTVSAINEIKKAKMRLEHIGFVFQFDSLLPEFTVLENIEFPNRILGRKVGQSAETLLERFGLSAIANKFPMELSGGEKQRAAMLRALRNDPALLIADEPTGNLDEHNTDIIINDLRTAAGFGKGVLMVTHNTEAAKKADRILHMTGGKLV